MQTSTVMRLSLCLLYLCISHSQSLSSFETCNCESWDEVCWDNCLSGQFAESKPFPCALIRSCQKHGENPLCKDVPTTIPSRCGDRKTEFPCGFIRACQKYQQHPDCNDVPTTGLVQCRSNTPSPSEANFKLNVNVYLSSSWRSELSNTHVKAQEVLAYASKIFVDDSLDRKILLYPHFIALDQNHPISVSGLKSFQDSIPSQYLKIGTLHMLLTHNGQTTLGLSRFNTICDKNNRLAVGIVSWSKDVNTTAQNFAHEAAHPLGIHHDFDITPYRDWTCGPGKFEGGTDNQIMNIGRPRSSTWSKCSNHDFNDYHAKVVANFGKFCLRQVL